MKNVDKKDEALNKLFSGYIEEAECPPEGVTFMAKEAMDENTVRERATELQLAAQTSHGGEQASGSGRRIPAKAYAVIAALFVLVAAVLLAVLSTAADCATGLRLKTGARKFSRRRSAA